MKEIILIIDYRNQFYSSIRHKGASFSLPHLKELFFAKGIRLQIKSFRDINFKKESFKNKIILYTSSEDPGLYYKDFIEDIILGLEQQGAILIPKFIFFRAHQNKVFSEILRTLHGIDSMSHMKSWFYGTYEDYHRDIKKFNKMRYVLKSHNSVKSEGVFLLDNIKSKIYLPKKVSRTFSLQNFKYLLSRLLTGDNYLPISNNRRKFIIQEFIPNIKGDYKILIYDNKYYVLYRGNRKKDFRASGSGNFFHENECSVDILSFAKSIYEKFDVPMISLDIGYVNGKCYLFEFQFILFGQRALENSVFYYYLDGTEWKRRMEKPNLENEFVNTIFNFLSRKKLL